MSPVPRQTLLGAITVHGSFAQITGEGTVGADGMITGRLSMDAASLDTKNSRRDRHLRSADFFDAHRHPYAVVTVTSAKPAGRARLACEGTSTRPDMSHPSGSTRSSTMYPIPGSPWSRRSSSTGPCST